MKVKYVFLFVLAVSYTSATAQNVTKQEIENNYVVAKDYMSLKNYDQAIPSLHWLLKNAPTFSKSVQRYAITAFETKANQVSDENLKQTLLDSMLIAFKSKEEHFGLSDLDKNKLAFRYYKYFRDDKDKLEAAVSVFQEVFASPETVINNNLVPYIYMMKQYADNIAPLKTYQINEVYDQTRLVVELKKSEKKGLARLDKYMSTIDNYYLSLLGSNISCETIDRLSSGLNRPDSVNVSKRLMSITLDAKCGRTKIYQEALELLSRNEPNPGLFKVLAQYEAVDKRYNEAIALYTKAFDLEQDEAKKASIHFDIAQLHFIDMNKSEARKYALSSIALDASQAAKSYVLIGKMYMNSFNECAEGDDPVIDRAVFFAAYDMFQKAGDEAGMEEAREQFPTKSQAFEKNYVDDDMIEIGCWINVSSKIRTRSSN